MNFTDEELDLLTADGYVPGYFMDIREGDLVAIPPVTRHDNKTVTTVVIERLMTVQADYNNEDGQLVRNQVLNLIGRDLDGRPLHLTYGNTYPCFIKREES